MLDEIINMLNAYREMEASCRKQSMHEAANRWQLLAEAAQRDLERAKARQETQAIEEQAWAVYQAEEGKPAEDEEEFGTPNAAYCNSSEPDHNGGWFCYHPSCAIEDYQAGLAFILDGQEPF